MYYTVKLFGHVAYNDANVLITFLAELSVEAESTQALKARLRNDLFLLRFRSFIRSRYIALQTRASIRARVAVLARFCR